MNYKKVVLSVIIICFTLFTFINLNAMTIIDELGVEYDENTTLCTNEYYTYYTTYEREQFIFVDSKTNSIIQANKTYDGKISIPVASNIEQLTIVERELDDNEKEVLSSQVRTDVYFQDCGNEVITEDVSYSNPVTTFTLDGENLTFNFDESYKVKYQYIDGEFVNTVEPGQTVDVTGQTVVQITEEKDNKIKYYEVYLNKDKNTYLVKDVDAFEVKRLFLDIINYKYVTYAAVFFVLFIIVSVIHRIKKRKYNKAKSRDRLAQRRRR